MPSSQTKHSLLRILLSVFCAGVFFAVAAYLAKYRILSAAELREGHVPFLTAADHAVSIQMPRLMMESLGFGIACWLLFTLCLRCMRLPVALVLVGLAALAAIGVQGYGFRSIRAERWAFLHLRDAIEQSAAPGEQVLVDDSALLSPLACYSSPSLLPQIGPASQATPDAEFILIASPGSAAFQRLAASGITLTESQTPLQGAFASLAPRLADARSRIYFASPAHNGSATEVSSEP